MGVFLAAPPEGNPGNLGGRTILTRAIEPRAMLCAVSLKAMAGSRNLLILIAAAACAAFGCAADPDADDVSSEDQEVMRAMIDIACKLDVDRIVISDRPAVPRASALHDTDHQNVRFGLDLDRRLAKAARWPRRTICPAVRVVADSDLTTALALEKETPPTWEHFSAAFGGARTLMRISLPVYSHDGKHAVIYTMSTGPYTNGAGFYHELEKSYGRWKIKSSINAWIS